MAEVAAGVACARSLGGVSVITGGAAVGGRDEMVGQL
jgi:hypothetical protein